MGAFKSLVQARRPVILDGAGGTELEARGFPDTLGIWSARAIQDAPELVRAIHRDYLEAGADIITAQTFSVRHRRFRKAGMEPETAWFARRGIELAREARDANAPGAVVAASFATLEIYSRTEDAPSGREAFDEHRVMADMFAEAGADFLLFEAFSTIRESYEAVRAGRTTGLDVVLGFVCGPGGTLLSGESIEEAVRTIEPLGPAGFAINCTPVTLATRAAADLARATRLPFGVYANVGDWRPPAAIAAQAGVEPGETAKPGFFAKTFGAENMFEVTPDAYVQHAASWRELGASFIGGCCGTRPAHIAELAARLR